MPILLFSGLAWGVPTEPLESLVTVTNDEGQELVGRLTLPVDAAGPVPVVFFVPGSGPWTYERPIPMATGDPERPVDRQSWTALHARLANERGLGFFTLSKRGCTVSSSWPWERVDREIFGKVTHQDLVDDLLLGLDSLTKQPGVDPERLMVIGASEGTLTGPRMIQASPGPFIAAALYGYVEWDEEHVTVWQKSLGSFRNVAWELDRNRDQRITRDEWEQAPDGWSWFHFDHDGDGVVTSQDMVKLNRGTQKRTLRKTRKRDDDWYWENVVNLNTGFVLEEWNRPPNHLTLLELGVPIGIFHGEFDGNVPVEGAISAAAAFEEAGRDELTLRIVPGGDHGLNRRDERQPGVLALAAAHGEIYDWLARVAQAKRASP